MSVVRYFVTEDILYYPVPDRSGVRWGIVFDQVLCLFVSFFVSLLARLPENSWTDLHELFREGVE